MAGEMFEVIPPQKSESEVGRSYVDLVEEWTNWLIMEKPEDNNNSNVVFLRGVEFPVDVERGGYSDMPVMMVGTKALEIKDNQAIFIPIIASTGDKIDHGLKDEASRRFYVRSNILQGDNPPGIDQLEINEEPIPDLGGFEDHLIYSRDYILHVPEATYGSSLKDFLDIPFKTVGDRPAITGGYFVLIKFKRHNEPKKYTVMFYGRGAPWQYGDYMASGLYEITVSPSLKEDTGRRQIMGWPARNKFFDKVLLSLERLAEEKVITESSCKVLNDLIEKSRHRSSQRVLGAAESRRKQLLEEAKKIEKDNDEYAKSIQGYIDEFRPKTGASRPKTGASRLKTDASSGSG